MEGINLYGRTFSNRLLPITTKDGAIYRDKYKIDRLLDKRYLRGKT